MYRLWAPVVCIQLLRHMALYLPPDISGFLAGRGPADAALRQQMLIEEAHAFLRHMAGVTADLRKCFNTISQRAVQRAFQWLGFPKDQGALSLAHLRRVFKMGSHCTQEIGTNHGCPDSCSVLAPPFPHLCLGFSNPTAGAFMLPVSLCRQSFLEC